MKKVLTKKSISSRPPPILPPTSYVTVIFQSSAPCTIMPLISSEESSEMGTYTILRLKDLEKTFFLSWIYFYSMGQGRGGSQGEYQQRGAEQHPLSRYSCIVLLGMGGVQEVVAWMRNVEPRISLRQRA